MHAVQQYLKIKAPVVKMVCENKFKSATSKKDGDSYIFEYIEKDNLPENHIKSKNTRPPRKTKSTRILTDELKKNSAELLKQWKQKQYKCPRCDMILTSGAKYYHNKNCK